MEPLKLASIGVSGGGSLEPGHLYCGTGTTSHRLTGPSVQGTAVAMFLPVHIPYACMYVPPPPAVSPPYSLRTVSPLLPRPVATMSDYPLSLIRSGNVAMAPSTTQRDLD